MGFVILFVAVVTNLVLCPRMPPRKSGPLVEWEAFKELSYMTLTLGIFLIYWTFFFVFFYVCPSLFPLSATQYSSTTRSKSTRAKN